MSDIPGTQAISRAFTVLRAVASSRMGGITLVELARQTGLSKPTAHRLLSALLAEGMIEQDAQSARYLVGRECFVLGGIANERFGLGRLAPDVVARLARMAGDSAFFSIRSDVHAVCVLREDGDFPLKTHVLLPGARHPLGVGAGSLAMLAAMDDARVEACLLANADLLASHYPVCDPALIRAGVARARANGYAVNEGLVVRGSWGVGVAVRDAEGDVLGALSIAAVESRLPPERQDEMGLILIEEAARLERLIGDRAPPAASPRRNPASRARAR